MQANVISHACNGQSCMHPQRWATCCDAKEYIDRNSPQLLYNYHYVKHRNWDHRKPNKIWHMISPRPILGEQASPGDPAQTGTLAQPLEQSPKQAESPKAGKWSARTATDSKQEYLISFYRINTRAIIAVKKTFAIRNAEIEILLSLMPFVLASPCGIVNIITFIDNWHISTKNRARVQGALYGLFNSGYIQLFDQRSNGSRFVGITPLGERVLTVYYNKVDELIKTVVLRRSQIAYVDNVRFARVDPANVGALYTKGMTTKYRHLYDRSKYFNADGSIKD